MSKHITYPNHRINPVIDSSGKVIDKGLTKREHISIQLLVNDKSLTPETAVQLADDLIEELNRTSKED
jgi:hypothetical protein